MIPVFDGHNDLLLRLHTSPGQRDAIWKGHARGGHLDLPRMKAGGFAGGFFAVYIPSAKAAGDVNFEALMDAPPYDLPLPSPIGHEAAQPVALDMVGQLMALARTGTLDICTSVAGIESAMAAGRIAAILHLEGADAIDEGLEALHVFHALGLRSLGPVWSRPTIFGHGVPFRFPGSPDTGPGLTDAGKRLVAECNRLRIMVDLSHLNAKGFDDAAKISDAPLVATHSNAHAVTPSTRNLTDRQLDMIRESGGMVGLNLATVFLREDGRQTEKMGWEPILRHVDHLIERLGEDHVGFGSDFDGATLPECINDVAGLPLLINALRDHGYSETVLTKLAHRNWLTCLRTTWGHDSA